ncbi:hypothetical protein Vadar_015228 [Vaccinium darrowii]|uniref:Uncharacterized protein n=1 Tax=Vaccinium darrowii TaxID=229202 RepID=A0ACB7XQX9_9ERIC|nr:hypothetical protein Vadar_015228 [Vaccinium darrowii]
MADKDLFDLEEGSDDSEVIKSHCLAGKILSPKNLNNLAVSNVIRTAWKTRSEFSIVPWSNNTFLFRFEDEEDRKAILSDGPWSVMNNLLVLHPLEEGIAITEIDFTVCPFWVQVHGLPVDKMTRNNAEAIGRRFGNLLGVEAATDGLLLNRSFLRVRVGINLELPLPKGFWLRRTTNSGTDRWIWYKYEKLADFCYACGRIGHDNKGCRFVSREAGLTSGYGSELKTSRARNPLIPGAPIHKQREQAEDRLSELFRRKPNIHFDNGGACIANGSKESDTSLPLQNIRTRVVGMEEQRSSESVLVFESPSGSYPMNPGNTCAPTVKSPDANTVNFSVIGSPSGPNEFSISSSEPITPSKPITSTKPNTLTLTKPNTLSVTIPTTLAIPNLTHYPVPFTYPQDLSPNSTLDPNHTPKTSPPVITSVYPKSQEATYYVTEPLDSPKEPASSPNFETHISDIAIAQSEPIPNNHDLVTTNTPDLHLTNVFQTLSIKRKDHPDPEFEPNPKLLRICAPTIVPPVYPTQNPFSKKPKNPLKKRTFNPKTTNSDAHITSIPYELGINFSMEDSETHLVSEGSDLVPRRRMPSPSSSSASDRALVAGPKQPPARC